MQISGVVEVFDVDPKSPTLAARGGVGGVFVKKLKRACCGQVYTGIGRDNRESEIGF